MKTLIEILKEETQSLKVQYIQKTEEWAKAKFNEVVEMSKWDVEQWCDYLGVKSRIVIQFGKTFVAYPNNFYNTSKSKELHNAQTRMRAILNLGFERFVQKEIKKAEIHYENSIVKLAQRIEKKGLDQNSLQVVTSHVGVNINTVLTDGVKTVKAWTIIASGEIQRPHYRYLVK